MKITIIAKNIDYCVNNLNDSAKKLHIDMEIKDFKTLSESLNYN